MMQHNPELDLAFNFVKYTNKNVFLTGKAGTGKTTFLHSIRDESPKRMIVVAPTGVAAINAGGVTIHSFFQLPFGPQIPKQYLENTNPLPSVQNNAGYDVKKLNKNKINIIKSLDLLVIDEISMVRADLLDAIDDVLRRYRNRSLPFGGVQLLMIGDLQQLAPVVKDDEWSILRPYYNTPYFFSSLAFQNTSGVNLELKHIYRQSDEKFISLLNKIRENRVDEDSLKLLNERFLPNFKDDEGYITLTTHNNRALEINRKKLNELKGREKHFKASTQGEFPEFMYPTEYDLTLKEGAQVMFVKNDISADKLYYNGKIGKISKFDDDTIYVDCPDDYSPIPVQRAEWENTKYELNAESKEINETVAGKFSQYPLKLAWAITIHKSQGLTFEKAVIDANASFAHGQVYVALSRCKTMEGMVLKTPIEMNSIKSDDSVSQFTKTIEDNQPDASLLNNSRRLFEAELLNELFSFGRIQSGIFYCLKEIKENQNVLIGNIYDTYQQLNATFKQEVMDVEGKFIKQLHQLNETDLSVQENKNLQDRIIKASGYFKLKLENILEALGNTVLETDNKQVKKDVIKAFEKLGQDCLVKMTCLKACMKGFELISYLEERSLANLEVYKYAKTKSDETNLGVPGAVDSPELYHVLKNWRNAKAKEHDLPHYMILHQKALLGLSQYKPQNTRQLKSINGMGKKKVEQFGEELLTILNDFCADHGIEQPPPDHLPEEKIQKEKKVKTDTRKITFDLLQQGKTIEEIAVERGMVVSTIEGHLAHFIARGELEINKCVSNEKLERITEYFNHNKGISLSEAKQQLGNDIGWGELKMVLAYLQHETAE